MLIPQKPIILKPEIHRPGSVMHKIWRMFHNIFKVLLIQQQLITWRHQVEVMHYFAMQRNTTVNGPARFRIYLKHTCKTYHLHHTYLHKQIDEFFSKRSHQKHLTCFSFEAKLKQHANPITLQNPQVLRNIKIKNVSLS